MEFGATALYLYLHAVKRHTAKAECGNVGGIVDNHFGNLRTLERVFAYRANSYAVKVNAKAFRQSRAASCERACADIKLHSGVARVIQRYALQPNTVFKCTLADFRRLNGDRLVQVLATLEHVLTDCRKLARLYAFKRRTALEYVVACHMQARQVYADKRGAVLKRRVVHSTDTRRFALLVDNLAKRGAVIETLLAYRYRLDVGKVYLFEVGAVIERTLVNHRQICPVNRLVNLAVRLYTVLLGNEVYFFQRRTVLERALLNFRYRGGNNYLFNGIVILERLLGYRHNVEVFRDNQKSVFGNTVIAVQGVVFRVEFVDNAQTHQRAVRHLYAVLINARGNRCRALFQRGNFYVACNRGARFIKRCYRRVIRRPYHRHTFGGIVPRVFDDIQRIFLVRLDFYRTLRFGKRLVRRLDNAVRDTKRRQCYRALLGNGYVDFSTGITVRRKYGYHGSARLHTHDFTVLNERYAAIARTEMEVGKVCVPRVFQRYLMRLVYAERDIAFALCKLKASREHIVVCLRDINLVQTAIDSVVVKLHVQLRTVLFINIGNFNGNGGRAVFVGLSYGGRIFGSKLQYRFILAQLKVKPLFGIAKHYRLRVVVVVHVYVQVNTLLFHVVHFIIFVAHARVLQNRRFVVYREGKLVRVFFRSTFGIDIVALCVLALCTGKELKLQRISAVCRKVLRLGRKFDFYVGRNTRRTAARVRFSYTVALARIYQLARLFVIHLITHVLGVTQQACVHSLNRRRRHIVHCAVFAVELVITGYRAIRLVGVHLVVVVVQKVYVATHRNDIFFVVVGIIRKGCPNARFNLVLFLAFRLIRFRNLKRRIIEHGRLIPVAIETEERNIQTALCAILGYEL